MLRYMQQALVDEVGAAGQQRLAQARVLIVGAGGLGTPLAVYLAGAGVGSIGIVDGDRVELSNLARQFMYADIDIGKLKAELLALQLKKQNPSISVHAHSEMLQDHNAAALFSGYDIICDCTDNAAARILCDKVCGQQQKPLVYAVVRDWQGYVTVLHHSRAVTLSQIFSIGSLIDSEAMNCSAVGIINSTCGIAGSLQAAEVIKIILALPSALDGGILVFNALDTAFRIFQLQ